MLLAHLDQRSHLVRMGEEGGVVLGGCRELGLDGMEVQMGHALTRDIHGHVFSQRALLQIKCGQVPFTIRYSSFADAFDF
jgi:hypothetical protein